MVFPFVVWSKVQMQLVRIESLDLLLNLVSNAVFVWQSAR